MLLWIATRQVEQIDIIKVRYIFFWVEEPDRRETVKGVLIKKRETLGGVSYESRKSVAVGLTVRYCRTDSPLPSD